MAIAISLDSLLTVADLLESLGGISQQRILMHPPPRTATEADLIWCNDRKITLCELVEGCLVVKGLGYPESVLGIVIGGYLQVPAVGRNLGIVTGASGPMRLGPGLVRLPDVAYTSWDRMPGRRIADEDIASFAPDLAVEVLNLCNTPAEMARKRREYLAAGVRLVWEVDHRKRNVAVFDAPDRSVLLEGSQTLDGGEVLPGFALPLAELFGELDRQGP